MQINNDLTVVLTLKGRHLHTLRWLWHANRTRLPFHVIIADGEVHPTISRLLSNPALFPNLSYEYHRHEDRCIQDYYNKMAITLGKVRSEYVVLADNDDFLSSHGICRSIAFLSASPEFVCAGARIPGFSVGTTSSGIPHVIGKLNSLSYQYIENCWYRCRDIDDSSASVRVMKEIHEPLALHYYVHRTPVLYEIAEEVRELNPVLRLCELYFALRIVAAGKVRSDPTQFNYFRQQGTSLDAGSRTDLVDDFLQSGLSGDFKRMASKVAAEATRGVSKKQNELEKSLYHAYAANLRKDLAGTMLRYRFPHLYALKQGLKSLWRPQLPSSLRVGLDKKRIIKSLKSDGADRIELAAFETELRNIIQTLQSSEFSAFVKSEAPDLLDVT